LGTLALVLAYEVWLLVRVVWMRNHDPRWTAMMDEREDEVEDFEVDIRWQPLSRISPHLVRAVIAAEDVNFIEHSGIDWYAVWDAVQTNRSEGQVVRGGSTITQQLAKNLFLSSWQSYIRKAQEAVVAYELEAFVGKRRIMEIYLNVIEWDDGIYGAEAAARHYFRRSARSLTPEQAAYLAAIIPGPRKAFNPRKSPRRHAQAHRRIRNAMRHVKAPEFES
jgi:monofunctional biosynthetic peptidoglycan transglycosylase